MYEAVYRHHLKKHPADVRAYLSVDGKDPPAELLTRLRREFPNLKPISDEPKEKGLRLQVEDLKWINKDEAEVHAGYWFPTKFAGEGYYGDHHLVRQKGRWVVEKVANEVMS
jgi:hypothetical protein